MRIRCEECGWETTKPTSKSAENSLRMHLGRVHGNIKNGYNVNQPQLELKTPSVEPDTKPKTGAPMPRPRPRRKISKRERAARNAYYRERRARLKMERELPKLKPVNSITVAQNGRSVELHHCPQCGLHLDAVATAMLAVNKE
jgi:hypothetical protein